MDWLFIAVNFFIALVAALIGASAGGLISRHFHRKELEQQERHLEVQEHQFVRQQELAFRAALRPIQTSLGDFIVQVLQREVVPAIRTSHEVQVQLSEAIGYLPEDAPPQLQRDMEWAVSSMRKLIERIRTFSPETTSDADPLTVFPQLLGAALRARDHEAKVAEFVKIREWFGAIDG